MSAKVLENLLNSKENRKENKVKALAANNTVSALQYWEP